ncbi:kinase domain protein [Aspergillus steynii IBT 23096]|uniref:Kinase domain protein n=1 Tax=Aspergillus steynii IBT 23096 TaxID=1392250 RepID=A0A2I2FRL3_9EURO|nr:kinase domain protein [Aspergillus steynii IBT 23096]PLB43275.1 kinase domain protein [Aspergillus steynii IBT 23096]
MIFRLSPWRIVFDKRPPSRLTRAFSSPYTTLPLNIPVEEETLPHYRPEEYYPVNIGDVYQARYQITGKLGYGAYSTSWLCRDLQNDKYKVLKMTKSLPKHPTETDRELRIYEHLARVKSTNPGQSLIRELYDSFDVEGPVGKHRCLILQPMDITLLDMMSLKKRPFDLPLLKMTTQRLLMALDFLHTDANVTHADIKMDSLMLSLEDSTMLADFAEAEVRDPSPRKKVDSSRTIYKSRRFRPPGEGRYGLPILCDFGEARIGKIHESCPFVQPHVYRAPEVIFEMPWGSAIDIWNLACLIWDVFEGDHLFADIFDSRGGHDPFKHLALMVALIGPPPSEFVKRSETTEQCFDSSGRPLDWVAHEEAAIPSISLEDREDRLTGEEKELFLQFIRSMLKWLPEDRKTPRLLLEDPWLHE